MVLKERQTVVQCNETESLETDLCLYGHCNMMGSTAALWGNSTFNKRTEKTRLSTRQTYTS